MKKNKLISWRKLALFLTLFSSILLTQFAPNVDATGNWTQIVSDDFNRADTAYGGVENDWIDAANAYKISSNTLAASGGFGSTKPALLRTETVRNGKISITMSNNYLTGAVARYNSSTSDYYYAMYVFPSASASLQNVGDIVMLRCPNDITNLNLNQGCTTISTFKEVSMPTNNGYKTEFQIKTLNNYTTLNVDIFNLNEEITTSGTITVADTATQSAAQWGVYSGDSTWTASKVSLSQLDQELVITPNKKNLKFGDNLTYTISDDNNRIITNFSDNGAGGIFSQNSVELNTSNNYTATITYTPTKAGAAIITAHTSCGNIQADRVNVWPYNLTIGFIGDKIAANYSEDSYGVINTIKNLGIDFIGINKGVRFADSHAWATNARIGFPILTNALTAFQNANVEIVHLMLGTNDAVDITKANYKNNLQIIINRLKEIGIKKIIISNSPYTTDITKSLTLLAEYRTAANELVAENAGLVVLGDTQGYPWFESNQSYLTSDGRPTIAGYAQLGQFWATAINNALNAAINPESSWPNGQLRQLGQGERLNFHVEKYFAEFANQVKVDGQLIAAENYTAATGSTVISLEPTYLDSLSVGEHTLSVVFTGGVEVGATFTITAQAGAANSSSSSNGSSSSSNNFSQSSPWTCADRVPVGSADLFQIDRSGTQATLYFTPVKDNVNRYHVVFGNKVGEEHYGQLSAEVIASQNNGVQKIIINHLDPKANYAFQIMPVNGCAVGNRSNWLLAKSKVKSTFRWF